MDTARAEKLKINFDIDFPRMPCLCELSIHLTTPLAYSVPTDLSIDAMDISGEHHLDVLHSVYKIRLGEDGQPIVEEAEQYNLGASQDEGEEPSAKPEVKVEVSPKKEEDKCGR